VYDFLLEINSNLGTIIQNNVYTNREREMEKRRKREKREKERVKNEKGKENGKR